MDNMTVAAAPPYAVDQCAALMNKNYRRTFSPEYFRWRYFNDQGYGALFIAQTDDVVVGCMGVSLRTLSNGMRCSTVTDMLIGAPFRGKGIFRLLEQKADRYARDHHCVVSTVLANEQGKNAVERCGWKHIGMVHTHMCHPPSGGSERTNLLSDIDSDIRFSKRNMFSFASDKKYRHWRFDQNPMYRYNKVELTKDIFSYTKLFIDPESKKTYGDIVDYANVPADQQTLQTLLLKTMAGFPKDISSVTTWALPHTWAYPVVRQLGFEETACCKWFCVKPLHRSDEPFLDFTHWHLVPADCEMF